jgi:hypothetical protein
MAFNPIVAIRARQLTKVRTFDWRDGALMACGCIALAGAAIAGSYASTAIACAMLCAIGAYYVTTALSRSASDDYDDSMIFAAGKSTAPRTRLLPDKASQ